MARPPKGRLTSAATGGGSSPICAYDAYGTLQTSGIYPGYDTTFRYAGHYTDPESGLQYLRVRYYDPASTQFLTVDPLTSVTGQPYGYTAGNPLNATDPNGMGCDPNQEEDGQEQEMSGAPSDCVPPVSFAPPPTHTVGAASNPDVPPKVTGVDEALGLLPRAGIAVIGKNLPGSPYDLGGYAPRFGEFILQDVLFWADQEQIEGCPDPEAEHWARNEAVLTATMSRGQPILDSYTTSDGELITTNAGPDTFLGRERNLLRQAGWSYSPFTRMWYPPRGRP
jgi:RHS repeat-associated protein